ncbi:MAG TPA: hypothetical protein VGX70_06320, partial [Gemmataceae bacterium]|nr:hypothetical protein [Gemmataceae bacterium]
MSRASLPLHVTVASPCPASWEEMEGNDRVRSCDQCQLQVYNLSAMSQQEAEDLLGRSERRLCVRLYQRDDGTVMTADCPLGLEAFRRNLGWGIAKVAGIAFFLLALLAGAHSSVRDKSRRPPEPSQGRV